MVGFLALCVAVQVYHLALGLDNSLPLAFFLTRYLRVWAGTGPGGRSTCWVVGCLGALGSLFSLASYVMDTLPALQG